MIDRLTGLAQSHFELMLECNPTHFNQIGLARYPCTLTRFKEARKGFSLLYCLWNDGRLQRRMFNGVGKLYTSLQLYCWAIL